MEKKKIENPFLIIVNKKGSILAPEDSGFDPIIE
jgi:hypothetical protein